MCHSPSFAGSCTPELSETRGAPSSKQCQLPAAHALRSPCHSPLPLPDSQKSSHGIWHNPLLVTASCRWQHLRSHFHPNHHVKQFRKEPGDESSLRTRSVHRSVLQGRWWAQGELPEMLPWNSQEKEVVSHCPGHTEATFYFI